MTLKLIQVYVTDKSGKPVENLSKEEFVVFDDGRAMTVTDFERHAFALPEQKPQAAAAQKAIVEEPPSAPLLSRKFFLFFDFAYNNPKGLLKAREAALHFLDADVRPDDELTLLSYSIIKGLTIHEFLSRDRAKVRAAIEAVNAKDMTGRAEDIEDEYWQWAQEAKTGSSENETVEKFRYEAHRDESKAQAEHYLDRLTALAKALRSVPGQKQIVLFSSGIPASMIYGHQVGRGGEVDKWGNKLQKSKFDPGDERLRSKNETLYKEFSASNCTLYTFDTREAASVPTLFAYDERTRLTDGRDFSEEDGVHSTSTDVFKNEKVTGGNTLKRLADITGGKYYSNINRFEKNLGQVQNLTSSYYVLGYRVGEQADGRFHEIRVEVKRKGCQVRAQSGYFNPKPFKDYSDLEKQLHLFDLALNQHSTIGVPKTIPMTGLAYDVGAGLRLRALARIPKEVLEDFSGSSAEAVALFFDEQENVAGLERAVIDLANNHGADVLFTGGTAPKPGVVKCRIILRGMDTGLSAVGSISVRMMKPVSPAGLTLFTPLILEPWGRASLTVDAAESKPDAIHWQEIYTYDHKNYFPVVGEAILDPGSLLILLPYATVGAGTPDVFFAMNIINSATGKSSSLSIKPLERHRLGSVDIQLIRLDLSTTPAGKYTLYINAGEKGTGATAYANMPLVVQR